MAAATLERWIDDRQSRGRYTFLRSEAVGESGLSAEAVKKRCNDLPGAGELPRPRLTSM
jgi:hypothetical protein